VGALGYGNTDNIGDDETPASAGYVDVGGDVVQVEAGHNHTCALLDTGAVRCWGESGDLAVSGGTKLGHGHRDQLEHIGDNETPASMGDISLPGRAVHIELGANHSCALLDDNTVQCWGAGTSSELPIDAPAINLSEPAQNLTSYWERKCSKLTTGEIECWGGERRALGYGHLPLGSSTNNPSNNGPIDVGGLVLKMGLGADHTCAVLDTGRVRCWGEGEEGALGYGSGDDVSGPSVAGDVPVY